MPKKSITKIDKNTLTPVQINIIEFDERFYQYKDRFAPSVTYLLDCVYPTPYGLINWIGDVGNRRAEEIRDEAGADGSFVHQSIEKLLKGEKISSTDITDKFKPKRSLKIKRCLQAFIDWYNEHTPTTISTEKIVWEDKMLYAGTMDYHCKINGVEWIIDFKTSNAISDKMRAQLSAYNYAETKGKAKQAILHLGNTTKKRYSFLEVEFSKYFKQFEIANKMFKELYPNAKPTEESYPEYFELLSS